VWTAPTPYIYLSTSRCSGFWRRFSLVFLGGFRQVDQKHLGVALNTRTLPPLLKKSEFKTIWPFGSEKAPTGSGSSNCGTACPSGCRYGLPLRSAEAAIRDTRWAAAVYPAASTSRAISGSGLIQTKGRREKKMTKVTYICCSA
jgi:hypothetical protein